MFLRVSHRHTVKLQCSNGKMNENEHFSHYPQLTESYWQSLVTRFFLMRADPPVVRSFCLYKVGEFSNSFFPWFLQCFAKQHDTQLSCWLQLITKLYTLRIDAHIALFGFFHVFSWMLQKLLSGRGLPAGHSCDRSDPGLKFWDFFCTSRKTHG